MKVLVVEDEPNNMEMANELETLRKAGCNGCLQKPIDPLTINDTIIGMIKAAK